MTKENIKRYLISSVITFLGTFFLIIGGTMAEKSFVFSHTTVYAAVFAALTAGARAVAKVIYEVGYDLLSNKE